MGWRMSKAKRREFTKQMKEIENFCSEQGIEQSLNGDSYYFTIDGQKYRVSNHSVEASDAKAYIDGEQVREKYHNGRKENVIYIHASKTRIIEIYNNLKNGFSLDGNGRII